MRLNRWPWFLMVLLADFASSKISAATNILAVTHVTVIDATGTAPLPDRTILIMDDLITDIGRSGAIHLPANATVVNATGKFVIPGLWDMHVHWYEKDYLPLFIANGVTGIRMMWGAPEHHTWRAEIEKGALVGPRMLIASRIVDGPKPYWPGSITAGNAAEGRESVAKAKSEGADFIKVYSGLPREAYFAIAEEAKKQGLVFAGHVPDSVSAREASRAGQKSIEHLTGILMACSSPEEELMKLPEAVSTADESGTSLKRAIRETQREDDARKTFVKTKAKALFAELKQNGTWQCPTLIVLSNISYMDEPGLAHDPRLKYIPRDVKGFWGYKSGWHRSKELFAKEMQVVGLMQRGGVGILAGTDTGNPYCMPGFSLHDELRLLVGAGLTPMQALQAATRNPAVYMGREKDMGTIEKGKRADLVLLDANPLANIANTRRINAVIFGGRRFAAADLQAMLADAEGRVSRSKMPIANTMFEMLLQKDAQEAVQRYRELRAAHSEEYDFDEGQLNNVGYGLMEMKRFKDAITILQLNVETFPKSANVYDSLGEACLKAGDKEGAARNYAKSLELDPGNKTARETLKKLPAP